MSRTQAAVSVWLRLQAPRMWWKVALGGIVAWVLVNNITASAGDAPLLALDLLLGAALMPFCFLLYWYEECGEAKLPSSLLGISLVAGGTVGLVSGALIESALTPASNWPGAVIIGISEEAAKGLAILLIARYAYAQLPHRLHGLLVGVAVGAGFAAVETLGYGLNSFIYAIQQVDFTTSLSFANNALLGRMILSPFGHVAWAGILGAAIWRERKSNRFELDTSVIQAFMLVVVLHALWDGSLFAGWVAVGVGDLSLPLFDTLIVGPVGLCTLAFFVVETRAANLPGVPLPVEPLVEALRAYYLRLGEYIGVIQRRPAFTAVGQSMGQHMGQHMARPPLPPSQAPTSTLPPTLPPTSLTSQPTAQPSAHTWPQPPAQAQTIPPPLAQPQAHGATPLTIYCPTCGFQSTGLAKFCSNCGHDLRGVHQP